MCFLLTSLCSFRSIRSQLALNHDFFFHVITHVKEILDLDLLLFSEGKNWLEFLTCIPDNLYGSTVHLNRPELCKLKQGCSTSGSENGLALSSYQKLLGKKKLIITRWEAGTSSHKYFLEWGGQTAGPGSFAGFFWRRFLGMEEHPPAGAAVPRPAARGARGPPWIPVPFPGIPHCSLLAHPQTCTSKNLVKYNKYSNAQ